MTKHIRQDVIDRYLSDPVFHQLVDTMRNLFELAIVDPCSMQEAVDLACEQHCKRQKIKLVELECDKARESL